jgi:hypothetical protein
VAVNHLHKFPADLVSLDRRLSDVERRLSLLEGRALGDQTTRWYHSSDFQDFPASPITAPGGCRGFREDRL